MRIPCGLAVRNQVISRGWPVIAVVLSGCFFAGNTTTPKQSWTRNNCPAAPKSVSGPWKRSGSKITAGMGASHHAADDAVVNPGDDATVIGKFAYGRLSKDLEQEPVEAWLQLANCQWKHVATTTTDDDGKIKLTIAGKYLREPGMYPYQVIVKGDQSRANGIVIVAKRGTKVVVFDVDGTLTRGNSELIKMLTLGKEPKMHPDANTVANHYVRQGYRVVYLTGRMYFLRKGTRDWLRRNDFPAGALLTSWRWRNTTPGPWFIGKFKHRILSDLQHRAGVDIFHIYGNAATDVCAYAKSGVDPRVTFIVGGKGGDACEGFAATQALTSYTVHLSVVREVPAVRPPEASD